VDTAAYRLHCTLCGAEYGPHELRYVCPRHPGPDGLLDVRYDLAAVRPALDRERVSGRSMWELAELLPVPPGAWTRGAGAGVLAAVGGGPLLDVAGLADRHGLGALLLKDDSRNPTGSYKDRASALVVVKARAEGVATITTASSGNAGAALAGMAAAAGLRAVIFVPESAPPAKVAQLLLYGARVLLVRGSYDQAYDLCLEASAAFGWYCRNTGYNPFTLEGKKTAAFEIAAQAGWEAPDWVFVGVGDGNILAGLHKGFEELAALGWLARVPRLCAVQAEGAAAVYNAWQAGAEDVQPVVARTLADSIAVGLPRDGRRALRAIRASGGACVTVSDDEILAAMGVLAREAGVFAEPAAAAAYAGVARAAAAGLLAPGARVVAVITGNGLKDVAAARRAAGEPLVVAPELAAVRAALGAAGPP
jgi:threonine synthase